MVETAKVIGMGMVVGSGLLLLFCVLKYIGEYYNYKVEEADKKYREGRIAGTVSLETEELSMQTNISADLLDDSLSVDDIQERVMNHIAERFAQQVDEDIVNGVGSLEHRRRRIAEDAADVVRRVLSSSTSISTMVDAMNRIAPIAENAGISMRELMAATRGLLTATLPEVGEVSVTRGYFLDPTNDEVWEPKRVPDEEVKIELPETRLIRSE